MVFYFTATGNSLYTAKKLDNAPISIPSLKAENLIFSSDVIGVVSPVYFGRAPETVINFLKNNTFRTKYFYLIFTYGNNLLSAPEHTQRQCASFGLKINYIGAVKTVNSYLPLYDMKGQKFIDNKEDRQIAKILSDLKNKIDFIPAATKEQIAEQRRVNAFNVVFSSYNNGRQLVVSDLCNGCGICTKVCPLGIFYTKEGKAKRSRKKCEFCLACAQNCPKKAIKFSKSDKNPNERYRNENIFLDEIVNSNNIAKNIYRGVIQ